MAFCLDGADEGAAEVDEGLGDAADDEYVHGDRSSKV